MSPDRNSRPQERLRGLLERRAELRKLAQSRGWSFFQSNRRIRKPLLLVTMNAALMGLLVETLPHDDCLPRWPWPTRWITTVLVVIGALAFAFLANSIGDKVCSRSRAALGHFVRVAGLGLAIATSFALPACSVCWSSLPVVVSGGPFTVVALSSGVLSTVLSAASVRRDWLPNGLSRRVLRSVLSLALLAIAGSLWNVALWHGMDETRLDVWAGWQIVLGPITFVSTFGIGYLALLQAAETADPPALVQDQVQYPSIQSILPKEGEWLKERRRAAGLLCDHDWTGRPKELIGLSLSGGGIRSATISLGFMQTLASTPNGDRTYFQHIDYLSTVSGGGWAGAAVTARTTAPARSPHDPAGTQDGPTDAFDITKARSWADLAERLRSQCDYLIPGGPGLTAGTARPILIVSLGAALNLASLWAFFATIIGILAHSQKNDGVVLRALRFSCAKLHMGRLFVREDTPIGSQLYTINVIGAVFAMAAAVLALGLAAMLIGMIAFQLRVREAGGWVAAVGFVACVPLGIALLAIQQRPELTYILAGIVASVGLALYLKDKLSQLRIASAVAALFAAEGTLIKIWPTLAIAAAGFTRWWSHGLERVLLWHVELFGRSPGELLFKTGLFTISSIVLGLIVSRNQTGLQGFWSAQISRAYLRQNADRVPRRDDSALWPLAALRPSPDAPPSFPTTARQSAPSTGAPSDLAAWAPRNVGGPRRGAPLHVIVAAVNTPGSPNGLWRKRGTARFEYTPYAIGGPATGWLDTERYGDAVTLAGAIATSAAAVNSQGGRSVPRWARALLSSLNFGLGVWMRNPRMGLDALSLRFRKWPHFWAGYTIKDLFGLNSELDSLVFVSDGGHHDNLGLSALVERECALIICLDASRDPQRTCDDFANVARLLRLDGEWALHPGDETLQRLRPKKYNGRLGDRVSETPVAVFELRRPDRSGTSKTITLVYVKSSLPKDLSVEVRRYAEANPDFPHESTADQFFNEAQFEAYRLLGQELARLTVKELEKTVWPRLTRPELAGAKSHGVAGQDGIRDVSSRCQSA